MGELTVKFREYNQHQIWLIPPDIETLISQNDICRTISSVVDMLDIKSIENKYTEEGNVAYHPRMMIKVMFYAYYKGIYSGRKIAEELERNIYFWYLSGKQCPDFRTICRFRDHHKTNIEYLFSQIVRLCNKLGMIKLQTVAIDGSKIKAAASNDEVRKYIQSLIEQGIETDKQEDATYGTEQSSCSEKINQPGTEELKQLYELIKQEDESLIDKDCRLMKMNNGAIQPAYNAQIIVDEKNQVIISAGVLQDANDKYAINERIEQLETILQSLPQSMLADQGYLSIDHIKYLDQKNITGYICDKEMKNLKQEIDGNSDGLRAGKYGKELFKYDAQNDIYICPEGAILYNKGIHKHGKYRNGKDIYKSYYSNEKACKHCKQKHFCTRKDRGRAITRLQDEHLLDEMKLRIRSKEGYLKYKKRMKTVEPVFANIKWNKGLSRFTVKGIAKVNAQFLTACCIHNIEKIHKWLGALPFISRFHQLLSDRANCFNFIIKLFSAKKSVFNQLGNNFSFAIFVA